MKHTTDIILVNPSVVLRVPEYANSGNIFTPEDLVVKSFNPGLLSIASYLDSKGYGVIVHDLLEEKNTDSLQKLLEKERPKVVGISCFSGFSYPSTLEIAKLVKQTYGDTYVITGGTHVGPLGELVFQDTSFIDVVALYEGELVVEQLLQRINNNEMISGIDGTIIRDLEGKIKTNLSAPPVLDLDDLPVLNWDLYPNPERFVPYIEESRGCFAKCTFCMSNFQYFGKLRARSPEMLEKDLEKAIERFGRSSTYAILASTFGVNPRDTNKTIEVFKNGRIKWTTETRVDVPWREYIENAIAGGLKVLNASPESGSTEILLRMQKTKNPKRYLEITSSLIRKCAAFPDFILKLNYLFYAGETPQTVKETVSFLFEHKDNIMSISCAPLMVYPGTQTLFRLQEYREQFGTSIIDNEFWRSMRIFPCNISSYFKFEEISNFARILDKLFNKEDTFYQTMEYKYGTDSNRKRKEIIKAKFN